MSVINGHTLAINGTGGVREETRQPGLSASLVNRVSFHMRWAPIRLELASSCESTRGAVDDLMDSLVGLSECGVLEYGTTRWRLPIYPLGVLRDGRDIGRGYSWGHVLGLAAEWCCS